MRTAIKRIFRRKIAKKKKGPGSREPTDDTTPDEAADKPVSLFQPKQGMVETKASSSTLNASSASINSKTTGKQSDSNQKSTSSSSVISPIREEFDQASVTSSRKSPTTLKETTKAAETMREPLDESDSEYAVNGAIEDEPAAEANNYDSIPVLEQIKLPRGGVSVETKAVGRVQVRTFQHNKY